MPESVRRTLYSSTSLISLAVGAGGHGDLWVEAVALTRSLSLEPYFVDAEGSRRNGREVSSRARPALLGVLLHRAPRRVAPKRNQSSAIGSGSFAGLFD